MPAVGTLLLVLGDVGRLLWACTKVGSVKAEILTATTAGHSLLFFCISFSSIAV
jgi:hypothetical protein